MFAPNERLPQKMSQNFKNLNTLINKLKNKLNNLNNLINIKLRDGETILAPFSRFLKLGSWKFNMLDEMGASLIISIFSWIW